MTSEKINKKCPCTWPGCPRHGKCNECQTYPKECGDKTTWGK